MAIVNSCCCWLSLRKGAFTGGLYTFILYTIMAIAGALQVHSWGPGSDNSNITSFGQFTPASYPLTIIVVICSGMTVMSSVILIIGLCLDNRLLLLPWVLMLSMTTALDFICTLAMLGTSDVHPGFALVITVDLFICILNIYCIVCVASLYQEYKSGRMWAEEYFQNATQNGQKNGVTSLNSANSKRSVTFIENDHVSKVLPTQRRASNPPDLVSFSKSSYHKNADEVPLNCINSKIGLMSNNKNSLSVGNVSEIYGNSGNLTSELSLWSEGKCNGHSARERRRSSAKHVQFQPTIEEVESSVDGLPSPQIKDVEDTSSPSKGNNQVL